MSRLYGNAVAWIASHETHKDLHEMEGIVLGDALDPRAVEKYITVALVSDVFGLDAGIVVADVCSHYKAQNQRPVRSVATARVLREDAPESAPDFVVKDEGDFFVIHPKNTRAVERLRKMLTAQAWKDSHGVLDL